MSKRLTRVLALCLSLCLGGYYALPVFSADATASLKVDPPDMGITAKGAILMEASTGSILYEKNPHEAMPPASVTKIMTLLLVMECIKEGRLGWEDTVRASGRASSMGGSQIFLKEGEEMGVEDLIKSVVIASANDAAVALAEHTYGSEEAFVQRMNQRARELGMEDTCFENTNGLDDTALNHVTSAADVALMSRALLAHEEILKYSSTWMDSIRGGTFGLTNTNRLVRFYRGCNGLKTGSTGKAGFCISATACREGMTLICVIMGAETRDIRNAEAQRLLDWGFATYGLFSPKGGSLSPIRVKGGTADRVGLSYPDLAVVLPKAYISTVEPSVTLPEAVKAPIREGEVVGRITYHCKGTVIGELPITATETSERLSWWELCRRMILQWLS